jgi:twinkle protein
VELIDDTIDFSQYEHREEWHKVRPASVFLAEVLERMANPEQHFGTPLPWSKVDGYRMRRSEVTVWAGINGHGKSMVLSHVMLHAMASGKRVVIASMEMTPVRTLERMLRQASCGDRPSVEYARKFHAWTDGKLWIYDHLGMVDPKRMLAVIRYCWEQFKPDHFVVDSLMKCGMNPDDYAGQKLFLNGLCSIALETGMHIHLVAHARKGEKETDRLDKFDIKGTSEITDQVDNVVLVQRNKRKEADKTGKLGDEPDAFLTIAKQRHGDWEGTAGLWFDRPSQSYLSHEHATPVGVDL